MIDKKKGDGEYKDIKDNVNSWTSSGSFKDLSEQKVKEEQEKEKKEEEELMKQLQEELDKLTSKDIIIQFMMSLSSLAYKKMGLPVGTNDKFKSKEQARLAIDSFDALLKVLGDELTAQERENLQASLTNLQMNFVKVFGI
jgi:hypothetical protein